MPRLTFGPNKEMTVQIDDALNYLLQSIWKDKRARQRALEELVNSKVDAKGEGYKYSTSDVRRWIHEYAHEIKR
jgi:hypothetical protein